MADKRRRRKDGRRAPPHQEGAGQAYESRPPLKMETVKSMGRKACYKRSRSSRAMELSSKEKRTMRNSSIFGKGGLKFPLEALRCFVEEDEKFKGGGISFLVEEGHSAMQCTKCGCNWDVKGTVDRGLLYVQVFFPWGLGYRFFYTCPLGCNQAYRWDEEVPWILMSGYKRAGSTRVRSLRPDD